MDVITRNFFRLLRAGAFGQQDMVEPMSVCKWRKTLQLSMAHGVEAEAYEGLEVLGDQFFVEVIPQEFRTEWADVASARRQQQSAIKSTVNERISKRLASIAKDLGEATIEYRILEAMAQLAGSLLTGDYWIRQLLTLGELIREQGHQTKRDIIKKGIGKLHLGQMVQLEGALLVTLMGVMQEELPFDCQTSRYDAQVEAIASSVPHGREQWILSQGDNIFVRTSNTSALVWSARRSARFFRYNPLDSVSQLFSSFARSLTNIEE
jgi:hypothetical protein